jgi:anti-sigma-K factor RskA
VRLLRHDLHILTGAYAVDAIDGPERERFEHHLRRCRPCGNEVRGLRETATRLALAAAAAPPPQLRGRVMALAAATRQLPPLVHQRARREPRAAWSRPLAAAAVVILLGVAIALGVAQIRTRQQLDTAQAQNQAIAAVLAAPDVRVATAASSTGGTATIVVSRSQQKMIFTTTGLPRLPPARSTSCG